MPEIFAIQQAVSAKFLLPLSRQSRAEAVGVVGGAVPPHILVLAGTGAVEVDAVKVFAVGSVQHVLRRYEPHSSAAAQMPAEGAGDCVEAAVAAYP